MQKSENHQTAKATRRQTQASTTLNRRYVKRPSKTTDTTVTVRKSTKVKRFNDVVSQQSRKIQVEEAEKVVRHPLQTSANEKMKARNMATQQTATPKVSAKELKDQAIQKALAQAATMNEGTTKKADKAPRLHFGFGRVMLALICAATAVFAIAYFVNLSMPDVSLKVAAMQTGIDAKYPGYVPRDYNISSITSESDRVSLSFLKSTTGDSFTLNEEKSAWDSNALESNFVKTEYGENYSIVREQGITIYVNDSKATWVNGGLLYKIEAAHGTLTEKQIRSIAVSL